MGIEACSCERGNARAYYVQCGDLLYRLSDCQLLKKDADACMMLVRMTYQKSDFYIPEDQRTQKQWAELKTAVKFWIA